MAPTVQALRQPPPSSGKLVVKDGEQPIVLRTRHILIDSGGELHAGSALCPFQGDFSIVLYGRWENQPLWGQMLLLDLMGGGTEQREARGPDSA